MKLLLLTLLTINRRSLACQPELVEDAESLISVDYERKENSALYVDTIQIQMKNGQQRFRNILAGNCNKRGDVTLASRIREAGSDKWIEKEKDSKINVKSI